MTGWHRTREDRQVHLVLLLSWMLPPISSSQISVLRYPFPSHRLPGRLGGHLVSGCLGTYEMRSFCPPLRLRGGPQTLVDGPSRLARMCPRLQWGHNEGLTRGLTFPPPPEGTHSKHSDEEVHSPPHHPPERE